MMKFKMNKVATAVAASLGVSVVGMNTAQSDEILFPYVVASNTVTTLLSVINDDTDFFNNADIFELHYRYYFKDGANAESKSAACSEVDFKRISSPNDVVTFDASNRFGQATLGVLFEDPSDQINVPYQALNQSFSGLRNTTKPVRAFTIVDNNDFFNFGFFGGISAAISPSNFAIADVDAMSLSGEALVLEFGSGAAWGYRAYNASGIYSTAVGLNPPVRLNPYDFSDRVETAGEVIGSRIQGGFVVGGEVATSLLPFSDEGGEFDTRLFVTPVSSFQLNGSLTSQVSFAIDDPGNPLGQDVIFDRDENPISGRVPMNVTCVAALDANDMLTAPARGEAPTGGWTNVRVRNASGGVGAVGANSVSEAIVIKLEFNEATGTLNGEPAFAGSFNSSFWLRLGIRESLQRPTTVYSVLGDDNSPCDGLATFATQPACLQ